MISPDPSLLRKAVSLVHCLQQERGASCAFSKKSDLFGKTLFDDTRFRTNTAITLLQRFESGNISKLPLFDTLSRVRQSIKKTEVEMRNNQEIHAYHKIIVMFNTLISTIIHSYSLDHPEQIISVENSHRERKHKKSDSLQQASQEKLSKFSLRQNKSFSNFRAQDLSGHESKSKSSELIQASKTRTYSLLKMLGCFVRLKESTGIERAILCSMSALGQVDHKLFNDLVLKVESQVMLIAELQEMKNLEGNLLHLIRESVDLPEPMKQLQEVILNEFNLEGFQLDMTLEALWNYLTLYMDRLHSLELMIVEELEYSLIRDHQASQSSSQNDLKPENLRILLNNLHGLLGDHNVGEEPAGEIKEILIRFFSKKDLGANKESNLVKDSSVKRENTPEKPENANFLASPDPASSKIQHSDLRPEPSAWDIDLYEIHFKKRIGRGTAGTTYLADWSGKEVAVKVAAITEMGLDGWKTEVSSLQKLHHPNIIRLLGSVYNENPLTYCLVLEYCNGGDLSKALSRPTHSSFFHKIALDVANGLNYLHSRNIIHRDVKPANVLLDGNVSSGAFSAKVTDFGLATIEANTEKTSETGTYRWMAPEVIRHQPYSQKADCYSYGILIWQLLTREDPFALDSPLEAAGRVALEGARPEFPDGTPISIKTFIKNCWADDPEERFSFDIICENLINGFRLLPEEEVWIKAADGHPVYNEKEYEKGCDELKLNECSEKKEIRSKDKKKNGLRRLFKRG